MFVEWEEKYATGIEMIDGHHKKLLDMLNKSYFMVLQGNSEEELTHLLAELIDYAKYHFSAEEELMRTHNYCNIDQHVREHFNFNNHVLTFQKEAREGKNYLSVDIFDFVRNWLLDHILKIDSEMSRAIGPLPL